LSIRRPLVRLGYKRAPGGVKMPSCSGKIGLDKVSKPSTAVIICSQIFFRFSYAIEIVVKTIKS
jgi:hypothetical protein